MAASFDSAVSATLAGPALAATGRAEIAVARAGQRWTILRIVTSGNSGAEPRMYVYKNFESPSYLQDSTQQGNGDSSETSIILRQTEKLIFVWTNGSPGAVMTATISGEREVN